MIVFYVKKPTVLAILMLSKIKVSKGAVDAVIPEKDKLSQTKDKDELLSLYNATSQLEVTTSPHSPRPKQDTPDIDGDASNVN